MSIAVSSSNPVAAPSAGPPQGQGPAPDGFFALLVAMVQGGAGPSLLGQVSPALPETAAPPAAGQEHGAADLNDEQAGWLMAAATLTTASPLDRLLSGLQGRDAQSVDAKLPSPGPDMRDGQASILPGELLQSLAPLLFLPLSANTSAPAQPVPRLPMLADSDTAKDAIAAVVPATGDAFAAPGGNAVTSVPIALAAGTPDATKPATSAPATLPNGTDGRTDGAAQPSGEQPRAAVAPAVARPASSDAATAVDQRTGGDPTVQRAVPPDRPRPADGLATRHARWGNGSTVGNANAPGLPSQVAQPASGEAAARAGVAHRFPTVGPAGLETPSVETEVKVNPTPGGRRDAATASGQEAPSASVAAPAASPAPAATDTIRLTGVEPQDRPQVLATHLADRIVHQARLLQEGSGLTFHLRLDPPALGGLDVRVTAAEHGIRITVVADRQETQQAIQAGLRELTGAIQDRGIVVQQTDVWLGGSNVGSGGGQQQRASDGTDPRAVRWAPANQPPTEREDAQPGTAAGPWGIDVRV